MMCIMVFSSRALAMLAVTGCTLVFACGGDAAPINTPGTSGSSGQPITTDGGGGPPVGEDGGTVVLPSACDKSAPAKTGLETGLKLPSGRNFSRFTAANYDPKKAHALVFVFHGDGGTGASARAAINMEALAGDDAIFLYPDGNNKTWDLDKLEGGPNADLAFVDALIAEHTANYCVNPKRIFSTGFSRGGYMANHVACRMGNVIRGVAPHAGGGPYSGKYDNQGNLVCIGGPVPAMIFNGLTDGSVPPAEGDKTVKYYARVAGCAASSKPADPSPCVAFDNCSQPVIQCKIPGLGHQVWNQGAKATWEFFSKFQ